MPTRIAIVDDNRTDADFVGKLLARWAGERQLALRTEVFPSAESFLFRYAEDKAFDILLLDIEMGRMDGVALAKEIRKENEAVQIVFITGYSDYIAEGYEVAALHYLMKPVERDKLFAVLDRAMEKRRQNQRCMLLEQAGEMARVPFYEVAYLDVQQNYVTVHGKEPYTVKRSLKDFEDELDSRFFRAGRGLILNLDHIRRVTRTEVTLDTGEKLPLPRGAYESLNRAIINHH